MRMMKWTRTYFPFQPVTGRHSRTASWNTTSCCFPRSGMRVVNVHDVVVIVLSTTISSKLVDRGSINHCTGCLVYNWGCTFGFSNCKVLKITTSLGKIFVSTEEQMQIPNGRGPSVQRSECPLLACYIRCKCSTEAFCNLVKGHVG